MQINELRLQENFKLINEETLISTLHSVGIFSGIVPKQGEAFLTNYRVAFIKAPNFMWLALGPIGAGVGSAIGWKKIIFQIIFDDIESISKTNFMRSSTTLFKMKDGNEYKLSFSNKQKMELRKLNIVIPD